MIDGILYRLIGLYPDWFHLELCIQSNVFNGVNFEQLGLWELLILKCLSMRGQPHWLCASLNLGPQTDKLGKYDFANGKISSWPGLSWIQTSIVKILLRYNRRLMLFRLPLNLPPHDAHTLNFLNSLSAISGSAWIFLSLIRPNPCIRREV